MKYQRATAEVIRFDECEEFMAASAGTIQEITNIITESGCGGFGGISSSGSFNCRPFGDYDKNNPFRVNGHVFYWTTNGNSGKWTCHEWD